MKLRAVLLAALVATPALAGGGWGDNWPRMPPKEVMDKANKAKGWHEPPLPPRSTAPLAAIFGTGWFLPLQNTVAGGIDYMLPGVRMNKAGYIAPSSIVLNPPPEYDRPFQGDLVVIRISMQHIKEMCPPFQPGIPPVACTTRANDGSWCRIVLAHDADFAAVGWNRDQILRHETAHCVGWPANHPGER